ncbi:helix-turn-helix transcriptional regulator [Salegentibacter sp. F188]|uniref:Helix-turn-helix transcriptional regulator n=1 Tax=Autumnicola patrickiae TaxID=3075591 RepID=A0ABU3E757_9FLAO|nr:helix-turn-helix transcriptional regulator [Salegentibacter sp. F188]MDT0691469.1 helix-turn-helix transcriptional regulator [Salegentibacter sp. F188]
MKENNSIGEILRKQREEKGLLLRQVAALLDVDTAILSKIERGERKAKKEQIVQLAKILNLDQEDLIVQFLSERILYEIQDEELGEKALKVAEQKIKKNNTKQIKD